MWTNQLSLHFVMEHLPIRWNTYGSYYGITTYTFCCSALSIAKMYLCHLKALQTFFRSTVEVRVETLTASLEEVYFPSVVICNVSPLRRSFMYNVMQNSTFEQSKGTVSAIWDLILVVFKKWANPGIFLFIFVLFSLQFQYKLNKV